MTTVFGRYEVVSFEGQPGVTAVLDPERTINITFGCFFDNGGVFYNQGMGSRYLCESNRVAAVCFSHVLIRPPEIDIFSHNAAQAHEHDIEQINVRLGNRTDCRHARNACSA